MATLELINKDTAGRVFIDARFSNGGVPFDDLPKVPSFPRWIQRDERLFVDMGSWAELLYRRSRCEDNASPLSFVLYRIGMTGRSEEVTGWIWPCTYVPCSQAKERDAYHWFLDNDSQFLYSLLKWCDPDPREIEAVREDILDERKRRLIRLNKQCRTSGSYIIEPYLLIGGYDEELCRTVQVFVSLTDVRSQRTCTRMLLETGGNEALDLIKEFVIKNGNLEAKPRDHRYSMASFRRTRGFCVPLVEPLSNFFTAAD